MNRQVVSAGPTDRPTVTATDTLTAVTDCPSCGYPKVGPGLCAYCRPVLARYQSVSDTAVLAGLGALP
jgi:hypothetical protein